MSTAPATAPSASAHDEEAPHGDDHVHTYETSGIMEGNLRVPRWLLAVVIALFGFFVWYIASQWGAQPTTARMKSN